MIPPSLSNSTRQISLILILDEPLLSNQPLNWVHLLFLRRFPLNRRSTVDSMPAMRLSSNKSQMTSNCGKYKYLDVFTTIWRLLIFVVFPLQEEGFNLDPVNYFLRIILLWSSCWGMSTMCTTNLEWIYAVYAIWQSHLPDVFTVMSHFSARVTQYKPPL